ncbi:HNH endonuclease signature motif containing protein [Streptomyces sp. NPDC056508]|uniref:HNH endonuclease signature motif containing protein n=1 Tax=Streptomyces sp. NPDC056508 TaxID=3345845 RepID=UPI003682F5CD
MRAAVLSEYPGYVIADDGRVQGPSGTWLRATPDRDGYLRIRPYIRGRALNARVHTLVCTAFVGDRPAEGYQVRHLNGVRDDNRAENLAWGTAADDGGDRVRHRTTLRGERHNLAKLTWTAVSDIRRRYRQGDVTQRALAAEFGVSQSQVWSVISGRTWIGTAEVTS